jgi:hypothetical protein
MLPPTGSESQVAGIPVIIPHIPNYHVFHNIVVYGNRTVDMVQDDKAKEDSFVKFQQGLILNGQSPGMQSLYAPDEKICTVSRHVVDVELIFPSIKKVCLGVSRQWNCSNEDSSFASDELRECKSAALKMLGNVNGLGSQIASRMGVLHAPLEPAFPVLSESMVFSCNIQLLESWWLDLFKWMHGVYRDFPSTKGLKHYPDNGNRDLMQQKSTFKDNLIFLATYRYAE